MEHEGCMPIDVLKLDVQLACESWLGRVWTGACYCNILCKISLLLSGWHCEEYSNDASQEDKDDHEHRHNRNCDGYMTKYTMSDYMHVCMYKYALYWVQLNSNACLTPTIFSTVWVSSGDGRKRRRCTYKEHVDKSMQAGCNTTCQRIKIVKV